MMIVIFIGTHAESGFSKMAACPDFTGSYLSFDGKNLEHEPVVQETDFEV